jgi:hypothetical protein
MEARGQRRMNRGTRKKELLALRALLLAQGRPVEEEEEEGGAGLYDRVLVDSDCTHDGSARHLAKVAGLGESMCVSCVYVYYFSPVQGINLAPLQASHISHQPHLRSQTRAGGFLSREKLAGLEALQRGLIWYVYGALTD